MTPSEQELRRVRSLIADLDGIVWEADAATMRFTFVSEGSGTILGYEPSEWLGSDTFWADRVHPEDRQRVVGRSVRIATAGGRFDEEYRFRARDGSWVWLRDVAHAVKEVGGRVVTIRGLMTEITGRKAADSGVVESERRFRRVVEHLPAIVYMESVARDESDPQMLYVSPQLEATLGFTPEEWVANPAAWMQQFHADDRERVRAEYARVDRTGEPFDAEYRMHARDGRLLWFHDEAVLVRDADGEPLYWQGIMYDITAERVNEQRARESEDRYRALVDQLPAIVYQEEVSGPGMNLAYISPRVTEVLGIAPEEWLADATVWLNAVHPDDLATVVEANERADLTLEPFACEYRMIARDGRVRWFRDEAVLVRDDAGQPLSWQGVMLDITARKEAESQLADAETRYRTLVEQIPAIVYLDPIDEGPTLYISPQSTDILGYTPEEWYADPGLWSRMVHPDDRARLAEAGALGEPHASVYRLIAKDGRTVWVHDQGRMVPGDDGRPRFWQGVLLDITQERRSQELERDLEREREEGERLRAEDRMKTTFLQVVAHDLRTPLAAILGLAVTMERDDLELTEDEGRDMARRIAQNARKLDRIVADFLDLERLNRGLATPHFEPVNLGALVRDLVAGSESVAERDLTLDAAAVTIEADVAMIERVLENLLNNTAKHTPRASKIWIRVERAGNDALVVVEDDGPGVPENERERIFEAFRQGSGAGSGSGVGLALVAAFAELHGGRAWVEQRPGGGASFRVRLAVHPHRGPVVVPDVEVADQDTGAGSSSADASQA
jgi:PAS domain S-box-containing protein